MNGKSLLGLTATICFFSSLVFAQAPFVKGTKSIVEIKEPRETFMEGRFIVKGEGISPADITHPGQRKIMAERAAVVVAQRNMLEVINGVRIMGDTIVEMGMTRCDHIRTAVDGFLKGAQTVYETYDPQYDIYTVYLSLPVRGDQSLTSTIIPYLPELKLPPSIPEYRPSMPKEKVAVPYDGLIVDIRGKDFKPALINRILTEREEFVYDPSKIASDVLVQRGCGDYTDDPSKAMTLLKERGCSCPLMVKAKEVVRSTDVKVSSEDAIIIFAANTKTNFLTRAAVVFVY